MNKWINRSLILIFLVLWFPGNSFAGSNHTIKSFDTNSLIKTDGSFWQWGEQHSVPTQIQGLNDVKQILGDQFLVKEDGSVWRWEKAPMSLTVQFYQVKELNHIVKVVSTYEESLAIKADGTVYYIPKQEGKVDVDKVVELKGINNVESISVYPEFYKNVGRYRWVFLKKDGTVWYNQDTFQLFNKIQDLVSVKKLEFNYALKNDGTVWTWPSDFSTQEKMNVAIKATKMNSLAGITDFKTNGRSYTAIDQQKRLWFWGTTITGFSDGTSLHHTAPKLISSIANVKDAVVVERSLVALTHDGKVFVTSINLEALPSNPRFDLIATQIKEIKGDSRHMIMQNQNGYLLGWGVNKNAQLGNGDYEFMHSVPVLMQKPISVVLNGEPVQLNNGVIVRNSQAFIPIRSIFEKMGAEVLWDEKNKTVQIRQQQSATTITVNFKSGETTLNKKVVQLQTQPFSVGGVSYIPLRFISESIGAKVNWIEKEDKITINLN